MLFDVHLGIHALHRDEMPALRKDAGIAVQINVSVWFPKNKVDLTILGVRISANLTVC